VIGVPGNGVIARKFGLWGQKHTRCFSRRLKHETKTIGGRVLTTSEISHWIC